MRPFLILIFCFVISSYTIISSEETGNHNISASEQSSGYSYKSDDEDSIISEFETYFLVIADTSLHYDFLHKKMTKLTTQINIPIDTMGRYYNKTKDLIALPDDAEDEIYAGDYFPKRIPTEQISLEYLNFYQEKSGVKTIALVTGIYETEADANNALLILRKFEAKAFIIKAEVYVGCMH